MNYANIKTNDIANGLGVRVSLFVSGCTHHCSGCFNEETWDFSYGKKFTGQTEDDLLKALSLPHIAGLSLLGGEPFEPANQQALLPFLRKVKDRCPEKNIWCYTGYLFDCELLKDSRARCKYTDDMLSLIDILVDGEFVQAEKDISLKFRGSKNQRIIDVQKSLKSGSVIIYKIESGGICLCQKENAAAREKPL